MATDPVSVRAERAVRYLCVPVDAASMRVWRLLFGSLLLIGVARFFCHGWIASMYVEPKVYFPLFGLEGLTPWPGIGMYVHFAVLGALATCIAFGVALRPAAGLFFLGFTYVELLDQTHYLNHYYLVSLLAVLLVFMPIGRHQSTAPRWCLWALRGQVGLVYFFAGVAKLGSDWLVDAQPLSIWFAANADLPLLGPLLEHRWTAYVASWAGAIFDLTLPLCLSLRRTRIPAFLMAIAFHLLTVPLFQLGMFPWLMIANATLFFAPDWPRRWCECRLGIAATGDRCRSPRVARFGLACLAIHFCLQVALPLRHFVFSGDPNWTEEGQRFAWRVMIAEKAGVVRYTVAVANGADGGVARELVYPSDYLTRRQEKMLAFQPEMIRLLARHIKREYAARGAEVQVFAEAKVSLNGRRSASLVDPTVDLSRVGWAWGERAWVTRGP